MVYEQFFFRAYQHARRWITTAQDAQDITADSFIKLYNRRYQFESLNNIEAFLKITVRNACFDQLRHIQMKTAKQEELLLQIEKVQEPDLQWAEIQEHYLRLIYAEVDKLPEKMKLVFLLSFRDGLKPAEIATQLGITPRTVTNQKINAINILRKAFEYQPALLVIVLANMNTTF